MATAQGAVETTEVMGFVKSALVGKGRASEWGRKIVVGFVYIAMRCVCADGTENKFEAKQLHDLTVLFLYFFSTETYFRLLLLKFLVFFWMGLYDRHEAHRSCDIYFADVVFFAKLFWQVFY